MYQKTSAENGGGKMPFRDKLLDLGLGAGFLQLGNQLLGVFLGDSFLQGLGAVVHQILGVLQAQAGSGTDNLDDTQLGSTGALQDNVELGLLFNLSGSTSSGSGNSGGSGGNAENLFQSVNQFGQLQNGQFLNLLNQSSDFFTSPDKFPPKMMCSVMFVGLRDQASASAGAEPSFCIRI